MASKGPRSKLDHETRARRQKALEAPKEPPRPKAHWDHVLEEMVWLSKDFEAERKWKLGQAKKVAIRASKSILDHATWGEKKVKEEEQRLRKVALNISKDVKKFWTKVEKLVHYKHQLELEEKKKKALDKQLDFLLGQTERYSTMLAENLIDKPISLGPANEDSLLKQACDLDRKEAKVSSPVCENDLENQVNNIESDDDYGIHSADELEDDERTIEFDEAHITEEERRDEVAALQNEANMPLEVLLKGYGIKEASREDTPEANENLVPPALDRNEKDSWKQVNDFQHIKSEDVTHPHANGDYHCPDKFPSNSSYDHDSICHYHRESNGNLNTLRNLTETGPYLDDSTTMDDEFLPHVSITEMDDETTMVEEEELSKKENVNFQDEITLLQQESEMSIEELLARYKKDVKNADDNGLSEPEDASSSTEEEDFATPQDIRCEKLAGIWLEKPAGLQSKYAAKVSLENSAELKSEKPADLQSEKPADLQSEYPKMVSLESATELKSENFAETNEENAAKEIEIERDKTMDGTDSEDIIADAAAAARSAQPTGNTFSTTKVRTKFPFLLKYPLREYQHIGLDWLVTMYEKRLNGILADEMGLGKTIMTIALLAHLACEKGIWGPHLIVVPTSVMLNWETEFLKWCPAFKILTYFGSAKERKHKRQGWMKPNSFHICITTYRLVIQDSKVFKRKKWKYLILDEAHLIKNWKSQRWQTLLNFNSKRRILLTGTPLQNDLMELWSLMHFLMPHVFQSHQEFKDWFCNPISGMVEGQEKVNKEVVDRLHNVLRPFILRRLKRDVEKQLPKKLEHVIYCRLSKRQRNLYEDFISSAETQATLANANYFAMISVIMQLRKVCNHPDLFEGRPIRSSFDMEGIDMQISMPICSVLASVPFCVVDLVGLNFVFTQNDFDMTAWEGNEVAALACPVSSITDGEFRTTDGVSVYLGCPQRKNSEGANIFEEVQRAIWDDRMRSAKERTSRIAWWNSLHCRKQPLYGCDLREVVTVKHPVLDIHEVKSNPSCYLNFSSKLADVVLSPVERMQQMLDLIDSFMFAIPAARAPAPICWCSKRGSPVLLQPACKEKYAKVFSPLLSPFRPAIVRRQVYFPDRRLIQFDCGKLQELAVLLRRLKKEGHRALIFTQMTKMLDILEAFINLYGYTYMRLDGSTQPEERQTLMQRFNTNPKIFLFILSTRSGGVGINLVGADTVIFYDSDWNPAMDQQAQDRCHRIGQTREVHIYRLVSESTIEENILKKANQKRVLDDLVIQSGSYNTEFFKKLDPMELFSGHRVLPSESLAKGSSTSAEYSAVPMGTNLSNADVEAAIKQAEDEADYMALKKVQQEEAVDNQEFTDEAFGRSEDDEFAIEVDVRPDERLSEEPHFFSIQCNGNDLNVCADYVNEETAIVLAGQDEDIDMLADVKQMAAAAAAAGHASSSFENQLRPIDRYAMRFLEVWDPIIDKKVTDIQIHVEEEEWELDRIEKFKEDLEAEIDEDQEPLVYERWDADFATTAYRQHVQALAQRQMMEEQERQLQQPHDGDNEATGSRITAERKPKSKKKTKKKKLKSPKKVTLASELEDAHDDQERVPNVIDDKYSSDFDYSSNSPTQSPLVKKRKKLIFSPVGEENSRIVLKRHKKLPIINPAVDLNFSDKQLLCVGDWMKAGEEVTGFELKHASKSKTGGNITIPMMPAKRVILVKPEKLKKRGHVWSSDCFPSPDSWSSQEDAILCAVVHEYGTHWPLASDILYSLSGGGFYRGRYRHPVHCCERFRELFLKNAMLVADNSNAEKISSTGTGKALLKVSEDHIRTLLNVTSELPDNELLLQKHFMAILASVWRAKCCLEQSQRFMSSLNRSRLSRLLLNSTLKKPKIFTESVNSISLRQSGRLVATAIMDADKKVQEEQLLPWRAESSFEVDKLDVRLDIPQDLDGTVLSALNVTIHAPEPPAVPDEIHEGLLLSETPCRAAENRFRLASEASYYCEGPVWASSAFRNSDCVRQRSGSRSQSLGKHRPSSDLSKPPKSKMPKTFEPDHELATKQKGSEDLTGWLTPVHNEGDDLSHFPASDVPYLEITALHEYDPDFIADLKDLGPLVDLMDIG